MHMMNGIGTRLRDVCALRYDVAQSHLSAGGSPCVVVTKAERSDARGLSRGGRGSPRPRRGAAAALSARPCFARVLTAETG